MEQTFFECKYDVTLKTIKARNKLSQRRNAKHKACLIFFIKIWFGITGTIGIVLALLFNRPDFLSWALVSFIGFIIFSMRPRLAFRRQYRVFKQISGQNEWTQTFRFGKTIVLDDGHFTSSYPYERIRFVEENGQYFHLFLDAPYVLTVDKSTFLQGNPEDFRTFIEERASGKEPLWTKREINRRSRKKAMPLLIIVILFILIPIANIWMFLEGNNNTPSDATNFYWDSQISIVEEVSVPGGLVVLGANDDGTIHSILLRKTLNHYTYVKGHSYSLTAIDEYNRASDMLFESKSGELALSNNAGGLVYGIAGTDWWRDFVPAESKKKYTAVSFLCGENSYILYYRQM